MSTHTTYTINTKPLPGSREPYVPSSLKKPAKPTRPMSHYVLAAMILLGLLYGGYYLWSNRLPSLKAPPAELAKFAATDRFANLSADKQKQYIDAFDKIPWADRRKAFDSLTDEEKTSAWSNIAAASSSRQGGGGRFGEAEKAFEAAKSATEKQAIISKLMDEMDARRAAWQANAATQPAGQGGAGRGGPGGGGGRGGWGGGGSVPGDVASAHREFRQAMEQARLDRGQKSHR